MFEIILSLGFVFMGLGIGECFSRVIRLRYDSVFEEIVFSAWIGWGWMGTIAFWTGLAGFWHPRELAELSVFFAILGAFGCGLVLNKLKQLDWKFILNNFQWNAIAFLVIFLVSLSVISSTLIALAPPIATDELSYHLALPKIFLAENRIVYLPYHVNSLFPLWTEMLYGLGLHWKGEILARLMHVWIGLWGSLGIWLLVRRFLKEYAICAIIAAAVFLTVPGISNQMSLAYNDVALSVSILFSFLAFLKWKDEPNFPNALVLGIFLGVVLSIKYLGVITVGLIGFLALIDLLYQKNKRQYLVTVTFIALGALVISGGWYLRNWFVIGNPFYPYFQKMFGGLGLGSEAKLQAYGTGKSLLDLLALPWNLTFHQELFGGWGNQLGPIFLVFLPFFFLIKNKTRDFLYMILFLVFYVLAWFFMKQNTRFLFPAIPFLAILIAFCVYALRSRSAVLVVLIFSALASSINVYHLKEYARLLLGRETREMFISRHVGIFPMAGFVNLSLPKNAHLLTQDHRGYYFDRRYTRERAWRRTTHYPDKFHDPRLLRADLISEGFTHLVLVRVKNEGSNATPILNELSKLPECKTLKTYEFKDLDSGSL
ncbi:MAG: phospholipid carrier-dependent glycosyltransferase, partial [Candidatus Omnitrophica bacterium]|nr:phospholipid carrier-dependent glycosyltransferase [Candidatus Omnitrophota bacterium]